MKKRLMILSCLLCSVLLLSGCSKNSKQPKVTLGDYSELAVDRIISEVTDEDVDEEINNSLYESADYNEITDRPAKLGDTVTVDYVGSIDGEVFDGGSEEGAEIELGSGEYIEGFEEGIVGMSLDETKTISIVFPEDYADDLAGKTASFDITLSGITEITLPELNDAYVQSNTDYSTVEEYKAALKDQLQMSYDEEANYMANYDALAIVVDSSEIESYPAELISEAVKEIEQSNAAFAEQFGMDVADLYGEDYDPEEDAKDSVKEKLVVKAIADKEKISVSDDEYNEYVDNIWDLYGYDSKEDFEKDNPKDSLLYQLLYEKVVSFLGEHVLYNDVTEEEYYGSDDDLLDEDGEFFDENGELIDDEEEFFDEEGLTLEALDEEELDEEQ